MSPAASAAPRMPASLQDFVAIGVALAAAAWLVRALIGRLVAPPCSPPPPPGGGDGFVPLDDLTQPKR